MARTLRNTDPYEEDYPRHSSRYTRRQRSPLGYMPVDADRARRARAQYYSTTAEERRNSEPRMAEEALPARRTTVKSNSRRHSTRDHRRSRYADDEPRRSRTEQREEDDGEYVYRTVVKDRHSPRRRSRQELGASRTTLDHSPRDSKRMSRSGTARRSGVLSPETERVTRYEDEVEDDSLDRPGRLRRTRTTSLPSSRPVLTRRSTRRDPPTKAPTSSTHELPASPSPTKDRRKSTSILHLFRHVPPPTNAPAKLYTCLVCLADDIPSTRSAKLPCGHRMCHPCLKRQFTLSVTDPQHMPPRCCTTDHIPLKHVDRLLSTQFKLLWNKKYAEYTTANRTYCPTPGCGEWIKPSRITTHASSSRRTARCTRCDKRVCVECGGRWHGSAACGGDEEAERFAAFASKQGWQQCFGCRAMVELKEGCNHMTCRCGAQFCMLCGAKWKSCECPWFNYEEPEEGDRLGHMRVPRYVVRVRDDDADGNADPDPRPMQALYDDARLARRRERDRERDRADEDLARRLQRDLLVADDDDREPEPEIEVEVYAVGNAGAHHLNDDFRVRPTSTYITRERPAAAPAAEEPRSSAAVAGSFGGLRRAATVGARMGGGSLSEGRGARSVRSGGGGGARSGTAAVEASVMAGLGAGSGYEGRVGKWLQHVENDPAAVEGRGG